MLLIAAESALWVILLAVRKQYIMPKMSYEMYLFTSTMIFNIFIFCRMVYAPKMYFNKNNVTDIMPLLPLFAVVLLLSIFDGYLYYYLLNKHPFSYIVSLNEIFIVLFGVGIGLLFLKEKMEMINLIGVLFAVAGIYLINK